MNVKLPPCVAGAISQFVDVYPPDCLLIEKLPKKNNLFLMIGPPTLPPKSFRISGFFGCCVALLVQVFASSAALRKSSYRRP